METKRIFLQSYHPNLLLPLLFIGFMLCVETAWAQQKDSCLKQTVILSESDVSVNNQNISPAENMLLVSAAKVKSVTERRAVIYLHFDLKELPRNAKIESVNLRLYAHSTATNTNPVFAYKLSSDSKVNEINWNTQPVKNGIATNQLLIGRNDSEDPRVNNFSFDISEDSAVWETRAQQFIKLMVVNNTGQNAYYSSRSSNKNLQPKLIIRYKIGENLASTDWPQQNSNAPINGKYLWQSNTHATSYRTSEFFNMQPGVYHENKLLPVIVNQQLIFPVQSTEDHKYQLYNLSIDGQSVPEKTAINAIPKWQPVVDSKQQIYLFTGHTPDSLKVLATGNQLKEVYKTKIEDNFRITANPAIGADGSLYLATDSGIYAFSAIPSLRIKWRHQATGSNNFFGSMKLNLSEDTVYVCQKDIAGKLCLVALDNINGKLIWENCTVQYAEATLPQFLPVPVISKDKIYLTSGYDSGTHFYAFNKANGESILLDSANQADISKAITGDSLVYIVNNGTLKSFNGASLSNAISNKNLKAANGILLDGQEDIYQLNTEKETQSFIIQYQNGTNYSLALPYKQYRNLSHNLFIPLPYGMWLIGDLSKFYRIEPITFAEKNAISIPFSNTFENAYLYRSEGDIHVKGKAVEAGQNINIHSFNAIHFQPGFSVKTGARLQCKTGKE